MKKPSFRVRFMRTVMALAIGGSAFQLSGCDPEVRAAMLTGLETTTQSLAPALISAYFLSLADGEGTLGGVTTTGP